MFDDNEFAIKLLNEYDSGKRLKMMESLPYYSIFYVHDMLYRNKINDIISVLAKGNRNVIDDRILRAKTELKDRDGKLLNLVFKILEESKENNVIEDASKIREILAENYEI